MEADFILDEYKCKEQRHVHEFLGSTMLAECCNYRHNHRFAGESSEAIPYGCDNHIHKICEKTDFFGHYHEIEIETSPAIYVCDDKHVHFVYDHTKFEDGHKHDFIFSTLIEDPLKK